MFKTIAIVVIVLVVGVLGYAATRPDTLRVARSAVINAPPQKIFAIVNDFHRWVEWSPYEVRDPAMKRTLSGADAGVGAVYVWDGNKDVGAGRMEILDAPAPQKITMKLDFMRPFEGHNTVEYTFKPQGDATEVTWAMTGPSLFVQKLFGVFVNLDDMIGRDFAAGLANLKTLAEK